MEKYLTAKEISDKWGISVRAVQTMCVNGKIEGAKKFGGVWAIPEDAAKPSDRRITTGQYKNWRKTSLE